MSVHQLASKRHLPLPLPDIFLTVAETFGLPVPPLGDELCYTLTRLKKGTQIGLHQGPLWWNLSYQTSIYPPGFSAARQWITAYAARYGYTARQVPRRRVAS